MRPILTIDLDAIADNWRALDRLGAAETAAVVKADAYGLGVDRVAPALLRAGARTFFVATGNEASRLAAATTATIGAASASIRIFVLNGPREAEGDGAPAGIAAGPAILPVISTEADLALVEARAAASGPPILCALQLETGMNRLGLTLDEQERLLARAAGRERPIPGVEVALIMSHFAAADEPESDLTDLQAAAFAARIPRLRAVFPAARFSLSATAGTLRDAAHHYDLVRPGVGLYGGLPFAAARPAARLEAPILRVWDVATGERSGYGGDWTAARPSRLATIPVGYADGLPRSLSGRGEALVGGRLVPFAGRVSMDLIVLDVTDVDAVRPGDWAILLDETLTVDRVAERAGTIGYEVLTSLGPRYERRYRERDRG